MAYDPTYQTKNYTAHGGKETVIGGKLTLLENATLEDNAGVIAGIVEHYIEENPETILTTIAMDAMDDSHAATVADLKQDFNGLLNALRDAGLMIRLPE